MARAPTTAAATDMEVVRVEAPLLPAAVAEGEAPVPVAVAVAEAVAALGVGVTMVPLPPGLVRGSKVGILVPAESVTVKRVAQAWVLRSVVSKSKK